MTDYSTLLGLIAPVFAMIGAGMLARWRGWLSDGAEDSLLKLVVNVLFPCLVFRSVIGNDALLRPSNIVLPPLVGFATIVVGFWLGYHGGRLLGLKRGGGLRTFAFAAGIFNYGYIPIPLVDRLFGAETLGVLFVHNVGCELAIWTVGVIMIAGASWRDGWRRAINAPAVSIVLAVTLNLAGAGRVFPEPLLQALGSLGNCAVPLGLVVAGSTMFHYLGQPRQLFHSRVIGAGVLLRLGLLPLLFLVAARWLPLPVELKQVMVVEAAMPAGMSPILLARYFGGQPLTAAQVIFGTTVVALATIPWWIRFGMMWVGL